MPRAEMVGRVVEDKTAVALNFVGFLVSSNGEASSITKRIYFVFFKTLNKLN